ncbi:MAG TPA: hypothetical protein VI814_13020 [Candidatus Limnocylindria bacterium]
MKLAAMVAALLIVPPACGPQPAAKEFALDVQPPEAPVAVRTAIPGERVVFLVSAPGQASGDGAIIITATAPGASVEIDPSQLEAGRVVEVAVTPDATEEETTLSVTIGGSRGGLTDSVTRSLPVFPDVDTRQEDAAYYRGLFVPWLAQRYPDLGIDGTTPWKGTISGAHLLVVSHYLFYNDTWELAVEWHVMIAPYDWATLYLRRRFEETRPSFAAKIDSVSAATPPYETAPPDVVRR